MQKYMQNQDSSYDLAFSSSRDLVSCFVEDILAWSQPSPGLVVSLMEPGDIRECDILAPLFPSRLKGSVALQ